MKRDKVDIAEDAANLCIELVGAVRDINNHLYLMEKEYKKKKIYNEVAYDRLYLQYSAKLIDYTYVLKKLKWAFVPAKSYQKRMDAIAKANKKKR